MDAIENHLDAEVDFELQDDKKQERNRFLYSLLRSLLQGRLSGACGNVASSNGGEALRQLLSNCQPKTQNRTMSLLQDIMSYPAFSMRASLLAQILKLEEHFNQHERLRGKIGEDMKAAVLLRFISGQLTTHLSMTLSEGSSYIKIRETMLAYDTATTRWNEDSWRESWKREDGKG